MTDAASAAPVIAPRYYLHNYRQLLDWVRGRYSDLLNAREQQFLAQFDALGEAAQALLVRLISRKGEWFRASKLDYPEIGDAGELAVALAALADAGLVQRLAHPDLAALFRLYTRPELKPWLGHWPGNKGEWLQCAEAEWGAAARDWQAVGMPAPLYADRLQLACMLICETFNLLFFGNLRQSLSEFVLAELGVFRYEAVAIDAASRSFQRREQLEAYLALHRLRDQFRETDDARACLQALGPEPDLAWLARRYHRFRFQLGYRLEQSGEYEPALQCYRANPLPEARPRAARVLEKMAEHEAALALTEAALAAPRSEQERMQLRRLHTRIGKALSRAVLPARRHKPLERRLRLPPGDLRVELAVAEHFNDPDAPVLYCENVLWCGLAGLLLWPAVFAPVPGAFFHPFQTAPKDLHEADFASHRRALIDQCLALLDEPHYRDILRARYREKQGIQSPFVHWEWFSESMLELALTCVPAPHIGAVTRQMLFDVQANRAGFPDLVQFYPAERRYEMIEVKGPGDRLQDNQRRWLAFFHTHQMPAQVVYVEWAHDQ